MAENIVLDRNTTEESKTVACKIDNKELRKRTYALNLAANATAKYLTEKGFSVDTENSLYKIPSFAQNLELADIYINKVRLDVRVTFDEKIFYIPKIQEKYEATPCAYIIVKLDSSLNDVEFLGFIPTNEIEKQKSANEYYCYESSILKPIKELEDFIAKAKKETDVPTPEDIEKTQELAVSFIDNTISESEKVYFLKNIIRFSVCREILCNMHKFDSVANQISHYEDLLNDATLSVLTGNEKEVDEALLANLSTVENAEENLIENPEETEANPIETTSEITEALEMEDVQTEELSLEEYTEENFEIENIEEINTEEMIKPMGVLSLDNEVESQNNTEESITQNNDIISDDLLDIDNKFILEENTLEDNTIENTEIIENDNSLEIPLTEEPQTENNEDYISTDTTEEVVLSATTDLELTENITELSNKTEDLLLDEPIENDDEIILGEVADLFEDATLFEEEKPIEKATTVEQQEEEPQKPFKLSLEGEEEEETLTPQEETEDIIETIDENIEEETPVNETIEETKDNNENFEEINDLSVLDSLSDTDEEIKNETQNEDIDENNEQLQSLLDDDLRALLTENDETSAIESTNQQEEYDNAVEIVEAGQNDETIECLFEPDSQTENSKEKPFELAQEPVSETKANTIKNVIILAAILLVLAGGTAVTWFMNNLKTNNDSIDTANQQDEELFNLQNNAIPHSDEEQQPALSQDINKSMTNSFSDTPAAITITKLSWQVSEKLAAESSVKEYLQTAGKNIQINLQNDLANSADINFNNSIKISFEIAPDNTMKGMQVLESSGSDQVDDIVLRSIKNTLKYISVPKLDNFNSDFFLTILINF